MSKISAIIITYNEEDYIGLCINSLMNVADEIIVVDSFSTDSTEEICKKFNVRFVKHAFEGFVEQKNWGVSLASNQWILSLDADEVLSEELKKSILEIKENFKYDGYSFNRRNNYCGKWLKHSEWYPNRQLRLFEKGKGRWVGLNPHDKFRINSGCKISRLKGDLLHCNCITFEEHLEKLDRNSSVGAVTYLNAGKRSGPFTAILHMTWCFFRSYILGTGFLDGYHGYKICTINAYGCYMKYAKLRSLIKEQKGKKKQE